MKNKPPLNVVIKDFRDYLSEIEKLTRPCSPEQKEHLANVLQSLLILIVGFKKGTRVGKMDIDHLFPRFNED